LINHLKLANNEMPEPFTTSQLKIIRKAITKKYLQQTALRSNNIPCLVLSKFLITHPTGDLLEEALDYRCWMLDD